jgi:hypothetical protein
VIMAGPCRVLCTDDLLLEMHRCMFLFYR